MPGSTSAGRREALDMILKIDPEPETILDVGAGAGQWYDLLATWFPNALFNGIEIFQPYIDRYRLAEKYTIVFNRDVREFPINDWHWDLVIFGDVLEHMQKDEAEAVVAKLVTKHGLISIPIGPCHQDPTQENPYEEHVATWTIKEITDTFPVISLHHRYDPISKAGGACSYWRDSEPDRSGFY